MGWPKSSWNSRLVWTRTMDGVTLFEGMCPWPQKSIGPRVPAVTTEQSVVGVGCWNNIRAAPKWAPNRASSVKLPMKTPIWPHQPQEVLVPLTRSRQDAAPSGVSPQSPQHHATPRQNDSATTTNHWQGRKSLMTKLRRLRKHVQARMLWENPQRRNKNEPINLCLMRFYKRDFWYVS